MVIPSPWQFALLALGAFRLVRLVGWDDLPPIARVRARLVGEHRYTNSTASNEQIVRYKHPTLAHFLHCPWCQGFWICLAVYAVWLAAPKWTIVALVAFALSSTVGVIARNLDP